jgi:hypothetical protein
VTLRASVDVAEPVDTGERFRVAVEIDNTSPRTTRCVSLMLRGFTSLLTHVEAARSIWRRITGAAAIIQMAADQGMA